MASGRLRLQPLDLALELLRLRRPAATSSALAASCAARNATSSARSLDGDANSASRPSGALDCTSSIKTVATEARMQGIPPCWGRGKERPAKERWSSEVSRAIKPRSRPPRAWIAPSRSRLGHGAYLRGESGGSGAGSLSSAGVGGTVKGWSGREVCSGSSLLRATPCRTPVALLRRSWR
jgi:hypothetical protein